MVQMRSLNLEHLDQLVVLLKYLMHLLQTLFIATQSPRVISALIADKTQDLE